MTTKCVCPLCADETAYSPICGDNGKTYANACWMNRDSCLQQGHIKIAKPTACGVDGRVDILFAIDGSTGVSVDTFNKLKAFAKASAQSYTLSESKARIGLIAFSNNVKQYLEFKNGITYKNFQNALQNAQPIGGPRNINAVLQYINANIFTTIRSTTSGQPFLVVFTTGDNQSNDVDSRYPAAKALKSKQVRIITVVIGEESFLNDAKKISSSAQDVIFVDDGITMVPEVLGDLEKHIGTSQGKEK